MHAKIASVVANFYNSMYLIIDSVTSILSDYFTTFKVDNKNMVNSNDSKGNTQNQPQPANSSKRLRNLRRRRLDYGSTNERATFWRSYYNPENTCKDAF